MKGFPERTPTTLSTVLVYTSLSLIVILTIIIIVIIIINNNIIVLVPIDTRIRKEHFDWVIQEGGGR